MARIRTIKPSLWSDDSFADLSRDARLLFIGLVSTADDDGRFVASTASVAGYVFPHDELAPTQVKKWIGEIEKKMSRSVLFYDIDGRRYGMFRNYRSHQRISHPQDSSLPPPPGQDPLL